MKLSVILGTRPEIIKLAPIIDKLNKNNSTIIFTGQHFDYNMGLKFIEQLGIRTPDYSLKIPKNDTLAIASIFAKGINDKTIVNNFLDLTKKEKIRFLALRKVPVDENVLGDLSKESKPKILQLIFSAKIKDSSKLERKLYLIRKKVEKKLCSRYKRFYICSFSSKTIIYKGLLSSDQLAKFYKDLNKNQIFLQLKTYLCK